MSKLLIIFYRWVQWRYSNSHTDSTVLTPNQPCSTVIPLSPLASPNTLLNFRSNLLQGANNLTQLQTPLIQTTFMAPPSPQLSPHSNNCPNPPIPSLPPLDLTPPTQNASEPDVSDDFFDPNNDDTDDDYGVLLEWLPSRPMVNYRNDRELEEDYKIGWEWLKPLIAPYTGFRQYLLDPLKTKPEDFFNALFDDNMYTVMAKETKKICAQKEADS